MKILVVDDSATMRGILRKALERGCPECEVAEASDGRAALRELGASRVDLMVTDLQMPGMDGVILLDTLTHNPILKNKKVLVFSSAISPDMRELHAGNPHIAFLSKPATNETICQSVRALLGQPSAHEPLPGA
jgi:CheY-like chemotaxis protein